MRFKYVFTDKFMKVYKYNEKYFLSANSLFVLGYICEHYEDKNLDIYKMPTKWKGSITIGYKELLRDKYIYLDKNNKIKLNKRLVSYEYKYKK